MPCNTIEGDPHAANIQGSSSTIFMANCMVKQWKKHPNFNYTNNGLNASYIKDKNANKRTIPILCAKMNGQPKEILRFSVVSTVNADENMEQVFESFFAVGVVAGVVQSIRGTSTNNHQWLTAGFSNVCSSMYVVMCV